MQTVTRNSSAAATLLANRVPLFAGTWLVVVALITLIETLQGRLRLGLALAFLVLHVAIVGGAVALRGTAHARTIVIALCGGLAASITGTFASFGGSAEILGVMLFALSASAAAFFVWGWEPQLALNAMTGTFWLLALPSLGVSTSSLELVGVTVIGWVITLGLAESMARTFQTSVVLRAREREAIEALQKSYDAYRDLAENARDFIWTADLDGRLTYANQATARILGDTPNALVGRTTAEFLTDHPENLDVAATLARVANGETVPPVAVECRTVLGRRWFEVVGTRIRDRNGRVVGVRVIGRDITERRAAEEERRRAEQALHESEARYRSLVESGLELIARADPSGKLLFANDAYLCAFGYRREDVEAGRVTILPHIHEDDRAAVLESFRRVQEPPYRNVIVSRVRIGGTWRRFEWEQGVVRDEHDTITEIQGAGRDVTERHVAEEALRRSLEDLRRSEETLRRLARRQAAIREEERRRLGLDLHDNVCQELAAVGVLLEVSRVHARDSAELIQATRHLAEVIEHLRLVSRELRPMMLSDLGLRESLRAFATNASSLQRRVTARFPTPVPRLDDETEIAVYRVAQESLGNALRHADARSIDLLLRIDDGTLLLEVRDDGRGFDRTTSRTDSLGLASMEERALALGGRLEIVSSPGRGTCIRLECPVQVGTPATAA